MGPDHPLPFDGTGANCPVISAPAACRRQGHLSPSRRVQRNAASWKQVVPVGIGHCMHCNPPGLRSTADPLLRIAGRTDRPLPRLAAMASSTPQPKPHGLYPIQVAPPLRGLLPSPLPGRSMTVRDEAHCYFGDQSSDHTSSRRSSHEFFAKDWSSDAGGGFCCFECFHNVQYPPRSRRSEIV